RNSKSPWSLLVAVILAPVPALTSATVAPGIARPFGSTTVPVIEPEMFCAAAHAHPITKKKARASLALRMCRLHGIDGRFVCPFRFQLQDRNDHRPGRDMVAPQAVPHAHAGRHLRGAPRVDNRKLEHGPIRAGRRDRNRQQEQEGDRRVHRVWARDSYSTSTRRSVESTEFGTCFTESFHEPRIRGPPPGETPPRNRGAPGPLPGRRGPPAA